MPLARSTTGRLPLGVLASAVLAAAPAAAVAAPSRAPSAAGLSIAPTGASPFLRVTARPGMTLTRSVRVVNRSATARVVRVTAADMRTAATGGITYPAGAPKATGRWLAPDVRDVRLAPSSTRVVTLRIKVPARTRSGQHFAGVVAVDRADARRAAAPPSGKRRKGVTVRQLTRLAIPVRVTIPGPQSRRLTVDRVRPAVNATGAGLTLVLRNAGTRIIRSAAIDLQVSQNGKPLFHHRAKLPEFVPGTAIDYPVIWKGRTPKGTYELTGTIRPDGAPAVSVNRTVRFTADTTRELEQVAGVPADTGSVPVWTWILAAAAAVSIVASQWRVRAAKRR